MELPTLEPLLPGLFWLSAACCLGLLAYLLVHVSTRRGLAIGWAGVLAGVAGLVVYKVADSYTGAGFDEASVYHLQLGWQGLTRQLLAPLLLLAGMLALVLAGLMWASWRGVRARRAGARGSWPWWASALAVVGLATNPGWIQAGVMAWATVHQDRHRQELLEAFAPLPEAMPRPQRPKSLVLVYAEGLERAFLADPGLAHLTPNLRRLAASAVDIRGIGTTPLTGWTIAGLAASQCGYPAVHGTNTFEGIMGQQAPCLTDVLTGQGYNVSYLNGSTLDFTNKGQFWAAHGVERMVAYEDIKALAGRPKAPSSEWGPYDDTLLEAARVELARLKAQPEPFALILLTLDTHADEGLPSPSCRDLPRRNDRPMQHAVACSDRLLGAFLEEVLAGEDEDLVVALVSDHLQPKAVATTRDLPHASQRDNLALFWLPGRAGREVRRQGTAFDLFPTFLHVLDQPVGRAGLGADLLDPDRPTLVERHGQAALDMRLRSVFVRDAEGYYTLMGASALGQGAQDDTHDW